MNKTTKKRLQQVEERFASVPIPPRVVKAAFATFCSTGELPDDVHLARLVTQRARTGYDCVYDPQDQLDWERSIRAAIESKSRVKDPLMDSLYDEAVWGEGIVRAAARQALRAFALAGFDPSEPQFAGTDIEIPDWGSVGIHLLGIPERLVHPPYEEQARRLFARYNVLRDRVAAEDPSWRARFGRAIEAFHTGGGLPPDGLLRDSVLADAELQALMDNFCGKDVSKVMAALDAAAMAEGTLRDRAIATVQELLRLKAEAHPS